MFWASSLILKVEFIHCWVCRRVQLFPDMQGWGEMIVLSVSPLVCLGGNAWAQYLIRNTKVFQKVFVRFIGEEILEYQWCISEPRLFSWDPVWVDSITDFYEDVENAALELLSSDANLLGGIQNLKPFQRIDMGMYWQVPEMQWDTGKITLNNWLWITDEWGKWEKMKIRRGGHCELGSIKD